MVVYFEQTRVSNNVIKLVNTTANEPKKAILFSETGYTLITFLKNAILSNRTKNIDTKTISLKFDIFSKIFKLNPLLIGDHFSLIFIA